MEWEKVSEHADRWWPCRSATEAHAAAVHYGRFSDTHASAVDTSQYTLVARKEGALGVETRAGCWVPLCKLKDCGAG